MNLSDITASIKLLAKATPTAFAAGSVQRIGVDLVRDYPDANVLYSRRITADAANDIGTIDLTDGSFTATSGSPTAAFIASGDFEGASLTLATLYAVVVIFGAANASNLGALACSNSNLPDVLFAGAGIVVPVFFASANPLTSSIGTASVTLGAIGDTADIHVLGKSS